MPTTVSFSHTLNQGPTMHQQSTLFIDSPAAVPSGPYFAPSSPKQQHNQRGSVSSFASRQSHSSSSSDNDDDDDDDSLMNRPSLHQILVNQGRGQYNLDNFGAFLQSQFCYENLAFWLASRQYKVHTASIYLSTFSLPTLPVHFHIFLSTFPLLPHLTSSRMHTCSQIFFSLFPTTWY